MVKTSRFKESKLRQTKIKNGTVSITSLNF